MGAASVFPALWAVFHSFLHGYHIAALNGVQGAVMCAKQGSKWGLLKCLSIPETQFGIVVTIYTLGGLLGSLAADGVTKRYGRVGTFRLAEVMFVLGTAAVGLSNVLWLMAIGRVAVGIGSGLSLVSVPLFLGDVFTSSSNVAIFGTLHQTSIGVGMIAAQSLSLPFARPWYWRLVLFVGWGVALVLFCLSWAVGPMVPNRHSNEADEETALLSDQRERERKEEVGVKDLFHADRVVKYGMLIVVAAQFAQQICGISPVMYFSTQIFAPVFHAESRLVALAIIAIGLPFNFVPGLIPRSVGSKRLILFSAFGTVTTAIAIGIGLNAHNRAVSGTSVILFVLLFSAGLAPIPWAVLAEVVPIEARTAVGGVAVSVNWLTNFLAGATFLPIQQGLKRGSKGKGNVFFVFAAASALAFVLIWTSYKLYDRAKRQSQTRERA